MKDAKLKIKDSSIDRTLVATIDEATLLKHYSDEKLLFCECCNDILIFKNCTHIAKHFSHKNINECLKKTYLKEYEGEWNKSTRKFFKDMYNNGYPIKIKDSKTNVFGTNNIDFFDEEFKWNNLTKTKRADIHLGISNHYIGHPKINKDFFLELQNKSLKQTDIDSRIMHYGIKNLYWFINLDFIEMSINILPENIDKILNSETYKWNNKNQVLTKNIKKVKYNNHLLLLATYKNQLHRNIFFVKNDKVYEIISIDIANTELYCIEYKTDFLTSNNPNSFRMILRFNMPKPLA